jgi:hypothetical protein
LCILYHLVPDLTRPIHIDACFCDYAFGWQTWHAVPGDIEPPGVAGGNFVDVTLRVVVHSAKDTLLIFRPAFPHGTTRAQKGVERRGMAITFSRHIFKAWNKKMEEEAARSRE